MSLKTALVSTHLRKPGLPRAAADLHLAVRPAQAAVAVRVALPEDGRDLPTEEVPVRAAGWRTQFSERPTVSPQRLNDVHLYEKCI